MVAKVTNNKREANVAEAKSDDEEMLATIAANSDHTILTDDLFVNDISDQNVNVSYLAANKTDRMYNWLADTGSTNHITNRREIFSSYEQTPEATVHGVGGKIIQVAGQGTVTLIAQYGPQKHIL